MNELINSFRKQKKKNCLILKFQNTQHENTLSSEEGRRGTNLECRNKGQTLRRLSTGHFDKKYQK